MNYKFCIKCGQKIPQDAVFCPHCGTKQMTVKKNNTPVDTPINRSNVSTSHNLQVAPPIGMYSDKKIIEFKHAMGFSSSKYNYGMGYIGHIFSWLSAISPVLGAIDMASKFYITCFENDGLLLMNLSPMNHFTTRNIFIPIKDIKWIGVTHGHHVEVTTVKEHTLDINFRYLFPLPKVHYLATNRQHLHQLVASMQSRIQH